MDTVSITLTHKGSSHTFQLRKGLGLQALSRQTDLIEFDCREADCGICICRVKSGEEQLSAKTAAETDFLRAMRAEADERLACQCRVFGDIALEIEDYGPEKN